jgi:hypothetical protein
VPRLLEQHKPVPASSRRRKDVLRAKESGAYHIAEEAGVEHRRGINDRSGEPLDTAQSCPHVSIVNKNRGISLFVLFTMGVQNGNVYKELLPRKDVLKMEGDTL